ncbi:MAG: RdgB/HAM1 family non-canonical purine NTP pyrophosphatase [Elusimicrobia bacterium]|jgi:non-canonical purine NTP pyrophosphatase (RdgB/HAM1 family)|nr:RdgB/HAM1 family non-canonical purine NTP pyrophosphatase [Elusimicrobiota bacterium]
MTSSFYLATKNLNKVLEIRNILRDKDILVKPAPSDISFPEETGKTFEKNALLKAHYLQKFLGREFVVGEDSGLVVEKLGGLPGVLSARFAGEPSDDRRNIEKLLDLLAPYKDIKERKAKFVTVAALIFNGKEEVFKGEVDGFITFAPRGSNGFGYDPVFKIYETDKTFAELTMEEKNRISHRASAFRQLAEYLLNKVK